MEKFIVSARKYRPQTFDTVVGQSHITTTLKNAIRHQQLAHAFLFCGPRGVGKTTCARILAKTINCEKQTKEGEACDKCQSCTSFNDGASMNYFELDGASNNSVDNIRDLVDQIRFVPQTGKYKVYVIDEVHMLSSSAFNAFLKTLEEPPSYAIFILATTEKHKILPTILSRCQIFDFKRITVNDTVEHLEEITEKEGIESDKASLQVIAQKSEGCMRDALSILDKIVSFTNGNLNYETTLEHLNILDADCYFKFLTYMQQQDLAEALLLYNDINSKGFEGDLVLNGFSEFIRNLLVSKDEKAAGLLEVVESFRERYIEAAKLASPALLVSALNVLSETEITYKSARNKRLHVELALIKLCYLQQALNISEGENGIVKKKVAESPLSFRASTIQPYTPVKKPISRPVKSKDESPAILLLQTDEVQPIRNSGKTDVITRNTTLQTQPATKLSGLGEIRRKLHDQQPKNAESAKLALKEDTLVKAWNDYIRLLKEEKNSAAQSFSLATLRVKDNDSFEVITANNIEQKFIEQERHKLFPFLQQAVNNMSLQYGVVIEENNDDRPKYEAVLSSKDQFLKMAAQYPLILELKERLKLTLDY